MRSRWVTVLAIGVVPWFVDCRAATEITIAITTDVPCADLRGTSVTVGRLGELEARAITASSIVCDASGDLGSLVIVPSGARTEELAIRIIAGLGRDVESCVAPNYGPGCVVARRALRYLPHTGLRIAVPLRAICNGVPCGATETCSSGSCVNATIADPAACVNAVCGEDVLTPGTTGTPGDGGVDGSIDGGALPKLPPPCSRVTPAITNATRTFYVDPTGADTNAGSSASPWQSLQHAADSVQPGDAVIARAGLYDAFEMRASGSPTAPIVFSGEGAAVIRSSVTLGGSRFAVNSNGLNDITIQGFTFEPPNGAPSWYAAVRLAGQSGAWVTGLVVQNNTFRMRAGIGGGTSDTHAVVGSWVDGLVMKNNVVTGTGKASVNISNSPKNSVVSCNDFADARGIGLFMNGDGTAGSPGVVVNALIENNLFHNLNVATFGPALGFDGLQGSRVQNNLIYGAHGSGIRLYTINAAGGSKDNVIVNNTLLVANGGASAVEIGQGATGNTLFNNILLSANPAAASISIYATELLTLKSDHNAVANQFIETSDLGMPDTQLSLAAWQMKGQEAHSLVAAPAQLFVSTGTDDYHLSSTSPAKNAGTPAANGLRAPPSDIGGARRPGAGGFDIGAYQSPPIR